MLNILSVFKPFVFENLLLRGEKKGFMCMYVHIYMCAYRDQKTMSDPLELKLHKAVSIHMSAGN